MSAKDIIETEPQVCGRDPLSDFCEMYISQKDRKCPIRESELASAFVKFFSLPPLTFVNDLDGFFVQTQIEIRESKLPAGLLGVNISFEGRRQVFVSPQGKQIDFRLHTVLHEIREIIGNHFARLGFNTTSGQNAELRADEFAFYAITSSFAEPLKNLFQSTWKIESKWRRGLALGATGIGVMILGVYSFMGAFFPHVTRTKSGIRFER